MVFIPIGTIIRFGECTSVHRAFAGMRTVAVRFPFVEGVPVIDRYGHFGGVAGLIGDDNFLLTVRRRENKAACFVKRNLRAVYGNGNGINILFVNSNGLRLAIGLAVLYALDNWACSVKHDAVRADISTVSRSVNQQHIYNILVIGINVEGAVILSKDRVCKLKHCHLPTGQQIFDLNLLAAVIGCGDGNGLGFLKEQPEGYFI